MARLFVFAGMMLAVLALAQASRFTITTTVVDEENDMYGAGQSQQRCQQQIQQQMQQIRHCQQYLSSPSEMDMDIQLYKGQGQGGQQQHQQQQQLRQCCAALQNFSEKCRCEVVKAALRMEQQGQGQGQQGQQMEQMRMKAKFLPRQCNMAPQQCQV